MEQDKSALPFPSAESSAPTRGAAAPSATDDARAANAPAWVDRAAQRAHDAVDMLAGKATAAANKVTDGTANVREAPGEWIASARDTIRENPFAAIGLAALAGLLIAGVRSSRR